MKWIKASERLPEDGRLNVKFNDYPNVIYKTVYGKWAFDDGDGLYVTEGDWQYIEWLDEAQQGEGKEPDTITITREEVERLRQQLEKAEEYIHNKL